MRIATWNLEAKATPPHLELLDALEADVLLLTEVPPDLEVVVRSSGTMALGQHFSALIGVDHGTALHESTVRGVNDGVTFLSSVLPWRSMGGSQAENTRDWLAAIEADWPEGPVVWGGDWNHELHGRVWVGSRDGQTAILDLLKRRDLQCPTATLQTRRGDRSINHIAVPETWHVADVRSVPAQGLSDHDAVVVDCAPA